MNKVLFVIPDKSYKSQDFVNAAKALKIDMFVVTDSKQASEDLGPINIFSTNFDYVDKNLLKKLPKDIKVVLPVDHSSVLYASKLCEQLSANGNSVKSVLNCLYKENTRRILSENNFYQPKYIKVKTLEEVNNWREINDVKIILKPNDGVASIGVMSLEPGVFNDAQIEKIINNCSSNEILVEEYFKGKEYAFEGYIKEGYLKRIIIFDKPGDYKGPFYEEKIFIAPADIDQKYINKIEKTLEKACQKLGLTTGPVHIEFKIINGEIFIIEVNPRTIGGLCSRSLNFNLFKNSLEEVILNDLILDRKISIDLASNSSGVLMLPISKEGVFKGIKNLILAEGIKEIVNIELSLPIGTYVKKPPFSERYLGFVFANGKTNSATKEALLQSDKILEPIIE
jgi:D-alanine-D-alanine ligase-like ATP-grasp enzyme